MAAHYDVIGSPFIVKLENEGAFYAIANKELGDHADNFFYHSPDFPGDASGCRTYKACFNDEVGESFPTAVHKFMKEVGILLEQAVTVLIREDTPEDDRDQYAVAGPTELSIINETQKGSMMRAAKELIRVPEEQRTPQLRRLIAKLSSPNATPENTPLDTTPEHYLERIDEGTVLIACQQREDGDYDVIGSLKLEVILANGLEYATEKVRKFLAMHDEAEHFANVHIVPDVLTLADSATPAPAPV